MALIICTECGKEISDKAKVCPGCGFPIGQSNLEQYIEYKSQEGKSDDQSVDDFKEPKSGTSKKSMIIIGSVILGLILITGVVIAMVVNNNHKKAMYIAAVGMVEDGKYEDAKEIFEQLHGYRDSKERILSIDQVLETINKEDLYKLAERSLKMGNYEEALSQFTALGDFGDSAERVSYVEALQYCDIGNYEAAYDVLVGVAQTEEVKLLLKQIYNETRFFEGLTEYRSWLKNPDSITVNTVNVYYTDEGKGMPVFIATAGGENGFGGYSSGYLLIKADDTNSNKYICVGACDSLDPDDYTSSDDLYEGLIAVMISAVQEHASLDENGVDINRVEKIVSGGNFSRITIVKELTLNMFEASQL